MFVTSHVLSGVLIGRATRGRPVTAFVTGVGSHLALDTLPHWRCEKGEDGSDEAFLRVARRDGLIGLATIGAAMMAVDRRDRVSTLAAIAGAVLLDLDKPCKHFFGTNPFPAPVVRIHSLAQNESPDGMPRELAYGSVLAAANVAMISTGRRHARGWRGGNRPPGRLLRRRGIPSTAGRP